MGALVSQINNDEITNISSNTEYSSSSNSTSGPISRDHNKQLLLTDPQLKNIVSYNKETNSFTCNQCQPPKVYSKSYHNIAIIKHVRTAHLNLKEEKKLNPNLKCNHNNCNKIFHTAKSLKEHEMIHLDLKEKCDYCDFENRKKDRVREHKKKVHPQEFEVEEKKKKNELEERKLRNADARRIRARDTARLKRSKSRRKEKENGGNSLCVDNQESNNMILTRAPTLHLTSLAPGGPLNNNLSGAGSKNLRILPNKKFKSSSELSLKVARGS